MAVEFSNAAVKKTFTAGGDLSGAQYKFVKIDNADGDVVVCTATTDRPIGVLQNDPAEGEAAEVTIVGGSKLVAGGSASAGQPLHFRFRYRRYCRDRWSGFHDVHRWRVH